MRASDLLSEKLLQPLADRPEEMWDRLDLNHHGSEKTQGSFDLDYFVAKDLGPNRGRELDRVLFWDAGSILVGEMRLEKGKVVTFVRSVEVRPSQRRNGYGLAMYLTLLCDAGLVLGCDDIMTGAGNAMWSALCKHSGVRVIGSLGGKPIGLEVSKGRVTGPSGLTDGVNMAAMWVG